jgi:hypothetical protein
VRLALACVYRQVGAPSTGGWRLVPFGPVPRVALGAAKPGGAGVSPSECEQAWARASDLLAVAGWAGGACSVPDGPVVVQTTEGGIFVTYVWTMDHPYGPYHTAIRWSRSKRLQPQASAD